MNDRIAEMLAMACNQGHPLRDKLIEGEVHALLDCAEALRDLLQDTQHAEHTCDDEVFCPVKNGHAALRALNGEPT